MDAGVVVEGELHGRVLFDREMELTDGEWLGVAAMGERGTALLLGFTNSATFLKISVNADLACKSSGHLHHP